MPRSDTEIGREGGIQAMRDRSEKKKEKTERKGGVVFEDVSVREAAGAFSVAWTGKALCQHRGVMGVSRVNRGGEDERKSI